MRTNSSEYLLNEFIRIKAVCLKVLEDKLHFCGFVFDCGPFKKISCSLVAPIIKIGVNLRTSVRVFPNVSLRFKQSLPGGVLT